MKELIEALQIIDKYIETDYSRKYPFSCEHDIIYVTAIDDPGKISQKDLERLDALGFCYEPDVYEYLVSYRYGSS